MDTLEPSTPGARPQDAGHTVPYVQEQAARISYPTIADFEILGELGRGGMGVVYKARQISLQRLVALKIVLAPQLGAAETVQRFYQEARAVARLQHPGVVRIFDIGEYQGGHFFTMEFVEGANLATRIESDPLSAREAAGLVRQVAETMQYAHSQAIIHRDLKPANILLDQEGRPKVTDFGLARQVGSGPSLTTAGQIIGTPAYMPPEQALGHSKEIGAGADIYSLGATFYCLLTGRPPFQAATALETLREVLEREPVAPRLLNPAVPRALEVICLKCLAKQPHQRYPSAEALAEDLRRWLANEPIQARAVPLWKPAAEMSRRVAEWVGKHPAALALTGVPLLLVGIWQAVLTGGIVVGMSVGAHASRRGLLLGAAGGVLALFAAQGIVLLCFPDSPHVVTPLLESYVADTDPDASVRQAFFAITASYVVFLMSGLLVGLACRSLIAMANAQRQPWLRWPYLAIISTSLFVSMLIQCDDFMRLQTALQTDDAIPLPTFKLLTATSAKQTDLRAIMGWLWAAVIGLPLGIILGCSARRFMRNRPREVKRVQSVSIACGLLTLVALQLPIKEAGFSEQERSFAQLNAMADPVHAGGELPAGSLENTVIGSLIREGFDKFPIIEELVRGPTVNSAAMKVYPYYFQVMQMLALWAQILGGAMIGASLYTVAVILKRSEAI